MTTIKPDVRALTDAEWREFWGVSDQGYSHRHWVDWKIQQRVDAALSALSGETETKLNEEITKAEARGFSRGYAQADREWRQSGDGGGQVSTEQRDKAIRAHALWCAEYGHSFDLTDFSAGWDAHAAGLPGRRALVAAIGNVAVASGDSETPEMPLGFALGDSLVADIADAIMALVNREGGQ